MMLKRTLLSVLFISSGVWAETSFTETVGKVVYQEASSKGPIKIPFFLWGGDVAFFVANG